MSVFNTWFPSIFGPSASDGEQMADHLGRWIGIKRRARENMRQAASVLGDLADFAGPVSADTAAKARAADVQCRETWDQVLAHDAEIMSLANQAVERGLIGQDVVDEYRRQLDDAGGGLGLLWGPLGIAIVTVAVALGITAIVSIYKLTDGAVTRANDTNATNLRGVRMAQDWEIRRADQTGQPPNLPTTYEPKGSPLVSVGVGAGGIGLLVAAVGGLLLLNSGGRRK